ncbi:MULTISPECIES: CheR family methyltransferase [unclassified Halomonas]|uniref:Chemotaxis protein methyltransferase n=1 Tax=Halomonas sp. RT37 TaxID=2950872 RepID=A0AAU7KH10_9GAMM|nr:MULTISPECIES: CheR family methyltransferase [unclassified Halomonas]MAY71246.1 chemotaxis protein CheR [Halomonas sp.]MBY5940618.1 chemotaxis protein CheR [Halomonas sp. DP5N14-9]MBY6110887.1 chemotaxis protein CheR [Halomonas sp. DP1Y21-3]MCJ8285046.1 chemotaxis protein CheR [Halomonas sp.]NQY70096.1 chemotaxis protein CheR [Halomonas sp.]
MNEPLAPPGSWSTSEGIPSLERDLLLTERDFSRIRQLIHERAGIVLAEHKREMVYSRLAKRLRHHGLTRFSDYLERLERRPDAREWEAFTNALTTNLTAFFREAHHFPLLAEHASGRTGGYRVWCAAASTGEEPYSIAMTLSDVFSGNTGKFEVIATDIDTDALARARAGVYSIEQLARLDEGLKRRHFLRGKGRHEGMARIHPDVSQRVAFQSLNLLAPSWGLEGKFDAIFCRNVMIYFDKPTQTRILERFAPLLKPDGLLFAGHSENFSQISDAFRLRGQTVYRLAGR